MSVVPKILAIQNDDSSSDTMEIINHQRHTFIHSFVLTKAECIAQRLCKRLLLNWNYNGICVLAIQNPLYSVLSFSIEVKFHITKFTIFTILTILIQFSSLSTFTVLCDHHHSLTLQHFYHPKKKPVPIK